MTPASDTGRGTLASPEYAAFLLRVGLWMVALLGILRLQPLSGRLVAGVIDFQSLLVSWYGPSPSSGVIVTPSCSGTDAVALCLAVTMAYPVPWRRRLVGAAIGAGVVLCLNVVRIGTLIRAANSPHALNLLHIYVWPVALTLVIAVYVYGWMRWAEKDGTVRARAWRRFLQFSAVGLVLYGAAVPWAFTSPALTHVAGWTASVAGGVLAFGGTSATVSGAILSTTRGAFQVTPECLLTPMLPLYVAATFTVGLRPWRRVLWLGLAAPIFFALGVARLLALGLPQFVADQPAYLAHGFYQLLAGAAAIITAAHLTRQRVRWQPTARTIVGLAAAVTTMVAGGAIWDAIVLSCATSLQRLLPATMTTLTVSTDQQGALALLPRFQIGLVVGLWVAGAYRPTRLFGTIVGVAAFQLALLAGLGAAETYLNWRPHVLLIRASAIGLPFLVAIVWAFGQSTVFGDLTYRRFWEGAGATFPVLTGAASTEYYFESERRLLKEALPALDGCTLLKTDLWDEAKNSRILQWAASEGARVIGVDISEPIVRQAREAFGGRSIRAVVGDVRRLPFTAGSAQAVYSMGTIEHFAETEASVVELARVLEPGGRLILGVPNRYDPFLRPLFVACLYRLGLYGYGYEKSFSRRALRRMIEQAGLIVRSESGMLFMPGWLRMLDLWCYTRFRPLSALSGVLVRPFAWLDRRFPALRRYGYLLVTIAEKPGGNDEFASGGVEYVVDAHGCTPDALRSASRLQRLFDAIVSDLELKPVAMPVWYEFPGQKGVTGMVVLAESHLTIHTFPETGLATLNLYCCKTHRSWRCEPPLRELLGASHVDVRVLRRGLPRG